MKIILFFFLVLFGCATPRTIHERKELVSWELRPRPGYKGLTSQRCLKWEKEKCIERDVVDFDLNDDAQRARLHDARFVCRVDDGPLFRICKELHGLCKQTVVRSGFLRLKKEMKLVEFINVSERYQYLIDKGTYCFSLGQE